MSRVTGSGLTPADIPRPDSTPRYVTPRTIGVTSVSVARWRSQLSLSVQRTATERPTAQTMLSLLTEEADQLETAVSRFREDSELSMVNRSAGRWVPVSWYFLDVLQVALATAEATDGLVDPTLGDVVDRIGYRMWRDGGPRSVPAGTAQASDRPSGRARPDWRSVEFRTSGGGPQVRIPPGCQLDLGAVAKAWLADRIAERCHRTWQAPVVANLGGDMRVIAGAEPWTVGVDPQIPGFEPISLLLGGGGMATSGQGNRRWRTPRGAAHHIVDPRTQLWASSRWWTVSVLAGTAVAANTASTASMIVDEDAPNWLARRGVDAVLIEWEPGQARPAELTTVGRWPVAQEAAA